MFVSLGFVCSHPETRGAQGGTLHASPSEPVKVKELVNTSVTVPGLVRANRAGGTKVSAAMIEAVAARIINARTMVRKINTLQQVSRKTHLES